MQELLCKGEYRMDKVTGPTIQNQLRENILEKANSVLKGKEKSDVFSSKIGEALKEVANSQTQADKITKDYELGKETDLTKVIMKQQVANIAFQLTLNVRNKVLSSYKDIMNMPI
tara:strand:- start:621 stop:965 length:345 start_codon:yes stop_codon:yes gene_type:complete